MSKFLALLVFVGLIMSGPSVTTDGYCWAYGGPCISINKDKFQGIDGNVVQDRSGQVKVSQLEPDPPKPKDPK